MNQPLKLAARLIVTLCAAVASVQLASAQDGAALQTTSTPNAYAYVINRVSGGNSELDGYNADSNGALTPLPGSPFWTFTASVQSWALAHTGNWLFASDANNIYSFSIASNGALTETSSINVEQFANSDEVVSLFLDHTGSTLYANEENLSEGTQGNSILVFQKDSTTGALTYLGSNTDYPDRRGEGQGDQAASLLSFTGNNEDAYNAGCDQSVPSWYAVRRNNDGTLTRFLIDPTIPSNPNGNYCPFGSAADPTNHLAVALFLGQSGPTQLGVYTADSSGNLTTNSTDANMPTTAVSVPNALSMSPAGNLLAVAGTNGLQVFYFNGGSPITPYTGRLAWRETYDLGWDKHNHLYSIGSGALQAWRITTTGWKQALGSPYPMNPLALTVLSK
jgi:hypothetical protein